MHMCPSGFTGYYDSLLIEEYSLVNDGEYTYKSSDALNCQIPIIDLTATYGGGGGAWIQYVNRVTFETSLFSSCSTSATNEGGGAVYADQASLVINNSAFTTCSASKEGGALWVATAEFVNVSNSNFSHCEAWRASVLISEYGGQVRISGQPVKEKINN